MVHHYCRHRADFFALGMWQDVADDGQTLWGDVAFAYRAYQHGFACLCSAHAICYHDDYASRDLTSASRRAELAARRAVRLFAKYPELIDFLPMFRDKTPIAWRRDPLRLITRKILRRVAAWQPLTSGMERIIHFVERVYPRPVLLRPLYRWLIGSHTFGGYRKGLQDYGHSQANRSLLE